MPARYHVLILFFLFFCVHLVLFWYYGIRVLWDSAAYIEAADFVVANGEFQDIHHLYYSVPILIMAAFRILFPGTLIPILLFQCLLSGVAAIALYKSAEKIFNSRLAGLMAGVIFIIWLDNVHWNTTTMTESITRSVFCFVVYVVANWQNRLRDAMTLALLMIFVFFTRPTGIIPIIGAIVFVIGYNWKSLVEKPPRLISVALISTAAIIFSADRMLAHWDFTDQYLKGNVVTFVDSLKDPRLSHESLRIDPPASKAFAESNSPIGRVIMFIYENPVHFLKTAGLKLFYLIGFVRPYYSWPHNLYLVVWISLVYMCLVVGWKATSNLPIKLFVLTTIVLNCGLIGISSVDWDNRFYIPMEPGIVLLAGGGVAALLNRIKQKSFQRFRLSLSRFD
jgi:hypothetical protein